MISGFEISSSADDGEHDGTACGGRSKVGYILYALMANHGADHCFSRSNGGATDLAASSEPPKRKRGTRTHGKGRPLPLRYLSVDFRSTGSSSLVPPASLHKRQNDDSSGDGRETKKARHAELETRLNGLTKDIDDMKATLARCEEEKKAKESRHADSVSLPQDATEVKELRKELKELKDFLARNIDGMKRLQESRHASSGSSPEDATVAESIHE